MNANYTTAGRLDLVFYLPFARGDESRNDHATVHRCIKARIEF